MSAVPTQQMSDIAAPMPTNFQHVQVININQSVDIGRKYAKIYHNLGVTQVILGIVSIAIGATLLALAASSPYSYHDVFSLLATGIWCGLFFLVSGVLGIVSGKKPQYCQIVGAMVMAIFSVLAASSLIGMEAAGAATIVEFADDDDDYYDHYKYGEEATALHVVLAVIGGIEFIIAIVHSAYCGAPTCCSPQPKKSHVSPSAVHFGQVQTTALPGQQIVYVYPAGYVNSTMMPTTQQPVPMYYNPPSAPSTTNQQQSTIPAEAPEATWTAPPPPYQNVVEKSQL